MKMRDAKYYNSERIEKSHQKKYQEALEDFNSAIKFDPKFAIAYNRFGNYQTLKIKLVATKEAWNEWKKIPRLHSPFLHGQCRTRKPGDKKCKEIL